ncbi:MAG: response regulator [Candidatus Aureabacteria bacterium]|nr:response regulator [Candidatus Auribacterota bacterium]
MKKLVLLVDDEESIVKTVMFRLKNAGYDVVTAADGEQALEVARTQSPRLILLDIALPIMDGYEVCRRLKADARYAHIPIILFTASSSGVNIAKETKKCGAEDYLIKPFEPEDMMEKVARYIR